LIIIKLFLLKYAVFIGGPSMLAIGWPVFSVLLIIISAVMAELAGSYPAAGAMMTCNLLKFPS
jgi:hypothetical protein